jgi:ribosome recycling factor
MELLKQTEKKMQTAIEHLKNELKTLRTGRANAGMVENVMVEVYGAQMRIKDIATISIPEPRQILIMPFDAKSVHAVSKGIEYAQINLRPMVDGNAIRIKIPEMDSAVRQEMVKLARKKCEEAKISIRNIRREGNETAKKQKNDGIIPEDLMKKLEKNIQEITDKYCKLADETTTSKEKEITTI